VEAATMTEKETPSDPEPETIEREDGATIAYHRIPGKLPGVVFLTGYMSDMTGGKALSLEHFCRARGLAYLRFDYFGHGASSGTFTNASIGRWADDAVFALDHLTEGPQVLVGSSLGGWIMTLAAMRRPERIVGLLGIAVAPDFTEHLVDMLLTTDERAILERVGVVQIANPDGREPTPVTKSIIEEGRNHLVLHDEIPLDCPVRLIHGMRDADVPWQTSVRLAECLRSAHVEITLVKEAAHRLSEPEDLERLCKTLETLLGL
jgi:pimeloyl-ACP methyl ester carboxylesterase